MLFGQQNNDSWDKFNYLIGNWHGEGSGTPGEGEGYFSFDFDLDKNILIRKSHSVYPASANSPEVIHNDLVVIYLNYTGIADKAIYFDNEGHIINYSIKLANENDLVFVSDKIPNVPTFRLTYTKGDALTVHIKFEMSQDGENFFTYLEGKSKKIM